MNTLRTSNLILGCRRFTWICAQSILSSTKDIFSTSNSQQYPHLCLSLHLSWFSPGSWDDSGLLTVFLLTSRIWFHLPPHPPPPLPLSFLSSSSTQLPHSPLSPQCPLISNISVYSFNLCLSAMGLCFVLIRSSRPPLLRGVAVRQQCSPLFSGSQLVYWSSSENPWVKNA